VVVGRVVRLTLSQRLSLRALLPLYKWGNTGIECTVLFLSVNMTVFKMHKVLHALHARAPESQSHEDSGMNVPGS